MQMRKNAKNGNKCILLNFSPFFRICMCDFRVLHYKNKVFFRIFRFFRTPFFREKSEKREQIFREKFCEKWKV